MEHGISGCWYQHTHFEHDIYVMILKEPGSPDFGCADSSETFSYIGRISGQGQHTCFSVHFACPPYGHDYSTSQAALDAGLAHGRAVIDVWRSPRSTPMERPRKSTPRRYSSQIDQRCE
ncbi:MULTISPECIES: hypothetical protein [unclassified Pseudomonas]|uniref:hypothetical protein n=1 Tax=unclassified Pseudomonas TaxID=196821 RepID=UPI000998C93B|nr:hypothetical protein [Pseudomonas sp. MF4836]OOV93530.1 hypothetical protein MF4836_21765 [Pseudomonas sp. MF4836]